ncbi:MAG: class I SAM-dependent methyltransferase [Cyanobacteria bacterium HKST-UBA05]|nr:class I SAM-dependent methyltransferase [Cyanobacteria bacterium HKST-UBA05]
MTAPSSNASSSKSPVAITEAFRAHHLDLFETHGATPQGLGWRNQETTDLRYEKMLAVIPAPLSKQSVTLLDVGCGFGGLYTYAKTHRPDLNLHYTGIDLCAPMIDHARQLLADDSVCLEVSSLFDYQPGEAFDFVVCNGILTQKLTTTIPAMDAYAQALVSRMFELARVGVAFNCMSSKVDYTEDHLYYRHPLDFLGFCFNTLSPDVRLDHSYPLYEYTIYVYHGKQG